MKPIRYGNNASFAKDKQPTTAGRRHDFISILRERRYPLEVVAHLFWLPESQHSLKARALKYFTARRTEVDMLKFTSISHCNFNHHEVIIFWCLTHCFDAPHSKPRHYSFRTVYRKKHNPLIPPASYQNYRFEAKGIFKLFGPVRGPHKNSSMNNKSILHRSPVRPALRTTLVVQGMLRGNCIRIF